MDIFATEERLKAAIKYGEILAIIYQGGSQPGTLRYIIPMHIDDEKVRARCLVSHQYKFYLTDKIEIVEGAPPEDSVKYQRNVPPKYQSLKEFIQKNRDELLNFGFHIQADDECLALHEFFKNGKPKKGPILSICYEEYSYSHAEFLPNGEPKEIYKRKRSPWVVWCKIHPSKHYSKLDRAAKYFFELVNSLSSGGDK